MPAIVGADFDQDVPLRILPNGLSNRELTAAPGGRPRDRHSRDTIARHLGRTGDTVNILIVDDHPLIVQGLTVALHDIDPSVESESAGSADQALAVLDQNKPLALILLDLGLPGAAGLDLLIRIRDKRPEVPVVVLSANDDREIVLGSLDAGAMGFISKRSATPVLVSALQLVLSGGVYIPPQVLAAVPASKPVAPLGTSPTPEGRRVTPSDLGLTDRQAEVLALLVEGKPNKIICRELSVSEGTVKTHVSAILRALNVGNRTQVLFALSRLGVQLPARVGRPAGR